MKAGIVEFSKPDSATVRSLSQRDAGTVEGIVRVRSVSTNTRTQHILISPDKALGSPIESGYCGWMNPFSL